MNATQGATTPCKRGTEWFSEDERLMRRAAELCAPCQLLVACRAFALAASPIAGVWGATLPEERAALRRKAAA